MVFEFILIGNLRSTQLHFISIITQAINIPALSFPANQNLSLASEVAFEFVDMVFAKSCQAGVKSAVIPSVDGSI